MLKLALDLMAGICVGSKFHNWAVDVEMILHGRLGLIIGVSLLTIIDTITLQLGS